jgi:hypothetical protein
MVEHILDLGLTLIDRISEQALTGSEPVVSEL